MIPTAASVKVLDCKKLHYYQYYWKNNYIYGCVAVCTLTFRILHFEVLTF